GLRVEPWGIGPVERGQLRVRLRVQAQGHVVAHAVVHEGAGLLERPGVPAIAGDRLALPGEALAEPRRDVADAHAQAAIELEADVLRAAHARGDGVAPAHPAAREAGGPGVAAGPGAFEQAAGAEEQHHEAEAAGDA